MPAIPPKLDVRTTVVFFNADRLLLLHRAPWKKIHPNRWTGIGGKVEDGEYDDLVASALRELFEETDLRADEISELRLRRALTLYRPNLGIVTILYFTGYLANGRVPTCNEGALAWIRPNDLATLEVIPNTARVLPLLIEDERRGDDRVYCGVATYDDKDQLLDVVFPEDGLK